MWQDKNALLVIKQRKRRGKKISLCNLAPRDHFYHLICESSTIQGVLVHFTGAEKVNFVDFLIFSFEDREIILTDNFRA